MPHVRIVIFLPEGILAQYDALAGEASLSRSALIRWALEDDLPGARDHVRSLAVSDSAPTAPLVDVGARRRGRPSTGDRMRRVAVLQRHAEALVEEAPHLDVEALRRLIVPLAGSVLGLPADSPLIDEPLRGVVGNPDTRPPRACAWRQPSSVVGEPWLGTPATTLVGSPSPRSSNCT